MDIKKIKLIIWDLDETFWPGVLSDGTAEFNHDNGQLIRDLTDAGVINSICSKNDHNQVEEYLKSHNLWDLFVFNSINWSPKGQRVKQIISEMNLREPNVLFIDDNHLNIQEVKASCPEIMAELPSVIQELKDYFGKIEKKDTAHHRLNQYKVLEQKNQFKASVGSNQEFLESCNIQVNIKYDCENHVERIFDLVQRSNQLNFTKVRSTQEELAELFKDSSFKCGYVEAHDRFGDYGIVGFFAIKEEEAVHFVFSCRTLNMGVEQYVYHQVGCPKVTVVGEVASSLEGASPDWINQSSATSGENKEEIRNTKLLIKGPCDLELVFSFIKEGKKVLKEFVYVGKNGVSIEGGIHTSHIAQALSLSKEEQKRLAEDLPFGDEKMYTTALFDSDIGAIYLSLFADPNLGLYREKSTGAVVAFGEWCNDLTDEKLWDKFISGELFVANCHFTKENLTYIKENYEYLGRITPEETVKNLDVIYSHIASGAKLILNLGSEIPYENNVQPSYDDRHLYHKELNALVRQWQQGKGNVYLIEATKYIKSQEDYTNNINHFVKSVYYYLAMDLVEIVKDKDVKVRKHQKSKLRLKAEKALRIISSKLKR